MVGGVSFYPAEEVLEFWLADAVFEAERVVVKRCAVSYVRHFGALVGLVL